MRVPDVVRDVQRSSCFSQGEGGRGQRLVSALNVAGEPCESRASRFALNTIDSYISENDNKNKEVYVVNICILD